MSNPCESLLTVPTFPTTNEHLHVPNPSDSSDDDNEVNDRKRPRIIDATLSVEEPSASRVHQEWEDFLQSGYRLKILSQILCDHILARRLRIDTVKMENHPDFNNSLAPMSSHIYDNAVKLANESAAECLLLERKLKEADGQHAALTAANIALRESSAASNERLERTLEALKVAGINAANARADADAAESFASSLASQLESLRNAVQETTRAAKVIKEEHEAVAAATRFVESNLLKRETELFHLQRDRKVILEEHEKLKESISKLSEDKRKHVLECQRLTEQVNTLNREIGQHGAMERSRKCRSEMLERELSDVRSLLVVASSTAVETETTTSALNETIGRVLKENKELHQKIEEIQETFRSHFERLQDALVKAEKTTQALRIDAASHSEQMNRVLSEKAGCEKANNQLKGRITNLEQRLKDTTEMFSSPSAQNTSSGNLPTDFGSVKKYVFSVPSLASPPNDIPSSASKSCFCCICLKVASGMMKTCKCGKGSCDRRAHSTCIAKRPRDDSSSSSHLEKLILCSMTSP